MYSAPLARFRDEIATNDLFQQLETRFPLTIGHTVARSEASAWRGSLPRLDAAIRLARLRDDVHITLEERVPYFSKRIDACLFGHDSDGDPHAVIVELKGWVQATARDDDNVETFLGGAQRVEAHPSAQAHGYQDHLCDYRKAFHPPDPIRVASCAYCHNYGGSAPDEGLFHPRFDALRKLSPTFGERDARVLADYLHARLEQGLGTPVLEAFDRRGIGPSKALIDHANEMIQRQQVFRLLDDQLAANNAILGAVRDATKRRRKHVILVRGGPGTGKSVIASNVLGEMMRRELQVYLVTGSSAFTHGIRRVLATASPDRSGSPTSSGTSPTAPTSW